MNDLRAERLQVMLSPEELAAVDDFRFNHRMPTRAAAVRELLKFGLAAADIETSIGPSTGVKSSEFGVFGRGPEGHTPGKADGDAED
jgi:antitoxin component HigA of HigAB toxin-antitoxin module